MAGRKPRLTGRLRCGVAVVKSICFSLLLIFCSTGSIPAQEKPRFIAEIERVFQEKEPQWKVESRNVQSGLNSFHQETVFRSGRFQAAVAISLWSREKDARDVFEGTVIAFDNTVRRTKKSLPNLGDENYM